MSEGTYRSIVSTFCAPVRPWLDARPSYSCRKSARGSFCRPEKYGALFERGAGIAPTPLSPVAEVAILVVGCSVVAVVEVGTVDAIDGGTGWVVVTGGWRLDAVDDVVAVVVAAG